MLRDNSSHGVVGFGSILLHLPTRQTLFINDVFLIPRLAKNLLSVVQITNIGETSVTLSMINALLRETH